MSRFLMPIEQVMNSTGSAVGEGWQLFFYETGTTTAKDTFSDNDLTTANANPVVADSAGRFGDIFLESGTYRVILKDADDVTIWDADPVDGGPANTGSVDEKTSAYTVTVGDGTKLLAVDASGGAVTITLPAAETAGDGFEITVKKTDSSANAVTVDGNGSETIDGSATLVLSYQYDSIKLRSDGENWLLVSRNLTPGSSANNVPRLNSDAVIAPISGGTPIGAVTSFAGSSAPSGWILCYGQAVSRTTYAKLFTVISTTYGVGDGSTTFNLPDIRGRVVAGKDDMGGTSANRLTDQTGGVDGDTLGDTGGAETHTLTTAQLAAHTHTVVSEQTGSPGTSGGLLNADASTDSVISGSTGGGGAHNNVQPTIILNCIIFAGA